MAQRAGFADLPLHGGRVPAWLGQRMARLGRLIAEAIVHHYGAQELLARLAHPFWFQAFGAVMGMDWHSSGITTSVIGALERGLAPVQDELGVYVCGGRGRHSRKTPETLRVLRQAVDTAKLGNEERLHALRELDRQARVLERTAAAPDFDELVARERGSARAFDGRTV